jgi:hypothetical protein
MRIKTARTMLSVTWIGGSAPLIVVVALQSLGKVYGGSDAWDAGWLWIMPSLFPIMGTIVGSWTVGQNKADDLQVSSSSIFWMTMLLSSVYLGILYGAIVIGVIVYEHNQWPFIIRSTTWFLVSFQWLITTALTKFFIENIRPATGLPDKEFGEVSTSSGRTAESDVIDRYVEQTRSSHRR